MIGLKIQQLKLFDKYFFDFQRRGRSVVRKSRYSHTSNQSESEVQHLLDYHL